MCEQLNNIEIGGIELWIFQIQLQVSVMILEYSSLRSRPVSPGHSVLCRFHTESSLMYATLAYHYELVKAYNLGNEFSSNNT